MLKVTLMKGSTIWSTMPSILGVSIGRSSCKHFHTSAACVSFWESNRHGHYSYRDKDRTFREEFDDLRKNGPRVLMEELKKLKNEWKEKFQSDNPFIRNGDTEIVFKFDKPESLERFKTTSDMAHSEGTSECTLRITDQKKALFSGTISTRVPKDGNLTRAGMCAFNSMRFRKSFKRDTYLDWTCYTHLLMRVRGDGRPYVINLSTEGYYDIHWFDIYNYVLYTRGGPYWQMAKIPFSKFYLSSKGRIQDKQHEIPLMRISHFGISCGDAAGPFQLEIDYVGVHRDGSHTEIFAYEMYEAPKYTVGV